MRSSAVGFRSNVNSALCAIFFAAVILGAILAGFRARIYWWRQCRWRKTMNRIVTMLAGGVCTGVLAGLAAPAHAAPEITLTRFECGTPQAPIAVNQRFSDTYAYGELKLQFVYSCYLVKHGDEYLLWDTGHAMTMPNVAPK
jgi:hypothetical protein